MVNQINPGKLNTHHFIVLYKKNSFHRSINDLSKELILVKHIAVNNGSEECLLKKKQKANGT